MRGSLMVTTNWNLEANSTVQISMLKHHLIQPTTGTVGFTTYKPQEIFFFRLQGFYDVDQAILTAQEQKMLDYRNLMNRASARYLHSSTIFS